MRSDEAKLPEPPDSSRPVYDRPGDSWTCGRAGAQNACPNGPSRSGRCPMADACHPNQSWNGKRLRFVIGTLVVFVLGLGYALRPQNSPDVFKPGELSSPHSQILSSTLTSARCAACHRSASISPTEWFNPDAAGHNDVSQTDRCLDCHHQTINRDVAKFAHNLPAEARKQIRARIRLASARIPNKNTTNSWHDRLPAPAVDQNNIECSTCHREHQGSTADLLAVSDAQCQTCHSDRFGKFAQSHPTWGQWPYGRGGDIAFNHQSHANKHFPATKSEAGAEKFDCNRCHQKTDQGEITRTVSYESGCQSCHNDSLQIESAKGVELFALPTFPMELTTPLAWPPNATGPLDGRISPLAALLIRSDKQAAESIHRIGNADLGTLNQRDPQTAQDLRNVAAAHERLLQDLADRGQVAIIDRIADLGISRRAMEPIVRNLPAQILSDAYSKWFQAKDQQQAGLINSGPNPEIQQVGFTDESTTSSTERREGSLLLPLDSDEDIFFSGPRIAQLSPASAAADELLSNLPADNLDGSDLIGEDPLAQDPLQTDPLAVDPLATDPLATDPLAMDPLAVDPLSQDPLAQDPLSNDPLSSAPNRDRRPATRFNPSEMMPEGGWYRDSLRLAVAYRGSGHSDPVLRASIELVRRLPPSDPVRKQLLATRAVTACMSCHTAATNIPASWHSRALVGSKTQFTKFTHGPHLNVSQLSDCQHCHQVNTNNRLPADSNSPVRLANFRRQETDNDEFRKAHEFLPLEKHACATCHTAKAAGESCVKCHRYHITQ
ncbi:cytochrome c3 family protein [Planctomycetes bacterium K23_9]|uniref:Doubled CXXCH motif domain-containing protein n=1 Tax=Stieleria marina TaxID=1930275 RepID=A0A517NTX1_9BACT|nr:hypothetical protein K239x_25090 [Planctomycetes bacterium K23_9]